MVKVRPDQVPTGGVGYEPPKEEAAPAADPELLDPPAAVQAAPAKVVDRAQLRRQASAASGGSALVSFFSSSSRRLDLDGRIAAGTMKRSEDEAELKEGPATAGHRGHDEAKLSEPGLLPASPVPSPALLRRGSRTSGMASARSQGSTGSYSAYSRRMSRRTTQSSLSTVAASARRQEDVYGPKLLQPRPSVTTGPVDVPERFKCPLTGLLMRDPVIIETGDNYERAAVEAWFRRQPRDPMTANPLYSVRMVRNKPLADEIAEWLAVRPGVEASLAQMAHERFIELAVLNQEQSICNTFDRSSFGRRHYGNERLPSEDFYHVVFEPPPNERAAIAVQMGLNMLSKQAGLDDSALVTKPVAAGGIQVTRQARRARVQRERPRLGEDVKNLLARLKLQAYEKVFRDWGFTELEGALHLQEWHLADMGMRVGHRLILLDALKRMKRAVEMRNKFVAKQQSEALIRAARASYARRSTASLPSLAHSTASHPSGAGSVADRNGHVTNSPHK